MRYLLTIFCVLLPAVAVATDPDPFSTNDLFYQSYNAGQFNAGVTQDSSETSSTGAFTYSYPITVPPGRGGMQPSVALSYNNQASDFQNLVGHGWTLSTMAIQRQLYDGIENLYTNTHFSSSFSGRLEPTALTTDAYGEYGAYVEAGDFYQYTFNSSDDSWTVVDKRGVTYTFGADVDSRQTDPDDDTVIFKWMISSIEDQNGNSIQFTYTKDEGQIYPETITYSEHTSLDGIFQIDFTYESRDDTLTSCNIGFCYKTNERLSQIQVSIDGSWVRKVELGYEAGDNGYRSLLASITETTRDESTLTETTLPATEFDYSDANVSWTDDGSYAWPSTHDLYSTVDSGIHTGVFLVDANGDARTDVLLSYFNGGPSSTTIETLYENLGPDQQWMEDTSHAALPLSVAQGGTDNDLGNRILDIDGDGHVDLVENWYYNNYGTVSGTQAGYINQRDGTWVEDTGYSFPGYPTIFYGEGSEIHDGVHFVDVNLDGLPDFVHSYYSGRGYSSKTEYTYINNGDGTGWTLSSSFIPPTPLRFDGSEHDEGVRLVDVNGDGLTDIVLNSYSGTSAYSSNGVYINQGDGTWAIDSNYSVPINTFGSGDNGKSRGVRFFDANGDGLIDMGICWSSRNVIQDNATYINKGDGTGWEYDSSYSLPVIWGDGPDDSDFRGTQLIDINGDGLVDYLKQVYGGGYLTLNGTYLNQGNKPDMLTTITHSSGSTTTVTYSASAQHVDDSGDPVNHMPYVLWTVDTITIDDGVSATQQQTTYTYSGGEQYFDSAREKQFAGFASITKTDAAGNYVTQHFHQGNDTESTLGEYDDMRAKIGKVYRTEFYDSSDNLYNVQISTWDSTDLGDDRTFVYVTDSVVLDYDGNEDFKAKAWTFEYDTANGNLLTKTHYGEVDASSDGTYTDAGSTSDTVITSTLYATDADDEIRSLPYSVEVTDGAGTRLQYTEISYDNESLGTVTTGNKTQIEKWIDGTDFSSQSWTYNAFGLTETHTGPRGAVTTFTYDGYSLYAESVENDLGHATTYTYNYSAGKARTVTGPNGGVTTTVFDGLDRVLQVTRSDDTEGTVTLQDIIYDDSSVPSSKQVTTHVDSATTNVTISYFDGLKRPVQIRSSKSGSGYSVVDTVYNERGQVSQKSLPYESSSSDYSTVTTDADLLTTTTYDALGRPTLIATALGDTQLAYDQWQVTVTDAEENSKIQEVNAYGHLISLTEYNDSGTELVTSYTLNHRGQVTDITDSQGNQRSFAYDGLGRRTAVGVWHLTGATEYQTDFVYDAAGNVETVTNPQGQVLEAGYDSLNRKTYELNDGETTEYSYDTCTNGVGRLCTVRQWGRIYSLYNFSYTIRGKLSSERVLLGAQSFETSYTYKYNDMLDTVSTPNGEGVQYEYHSNLKTESISLNGSVLISLAYNANNDVTEVSYGNGAVSTWTYDESKLYVIDNITTVHSDGQTLQDMTFAYDDVANITQLTHDSDIYSDTIDYDYDALYRLKEADYSSGTTLSYNYDDLGNMTSHSDLGTIEHSGKHPHAPSKVGTKSITYDLLGRTTRSHGLKYTWDAKNQIKTTGPVGTVFGTRPFIGILTGAVSPAMAPPPSAFAFISLSPETLTGPLAFDGPEETGSVGPFDMSYFPSESTGENVVYSYDHTGRRHVKIDQGVAYYYPNSHYELRDGQETIVLFDSQGRRLAEVRAEDDISYRHLDHLDSVAVTTTYDSDISTEYEYSPFGRLIATDDHDVASPSKHTYTGKEKDDGNELLYYNARYYNANVPAFVSTDPWDGNYTQPQTLNEYSYVMNNPIRYNDPTGAIAWDTMKTAAGQAWGTTKSMGSMAWNLSGAVSNAVKGNYAAVGTSTTKALLNFDDAMTNSANALNNTIQGLGGNDVQNVVEQGPYRDMVAIVAGQEYVDTKLDAHVNAADTVANLPNMITSVKDLPQTIQNLPGQVKNLQTASQNVENVLESGGTMKDAFQAGENFGNALKDFKSSVSSLESAADGLNILFQTTTGVVQSGSKDSLIKKNQERPGPKA